MVVIESTKGPKTGNYIEMVGSYNPRQKQTEVDGERVKYWISKGAQVSDTVHNILVSEKIIEGKKVNVLPKKSPLVADSEASEGDSEEGAEDSAPKSEEPKAEDKEEEKKEEAPAEEVAEEKPAEDSAPAKEDSKASEEASEKDAEDSASPEEEEKSEADEPVEESKEA